MMLSFYGFSLTRGWGRRMLGWGNSSEQTEEEALAVEDQMVKTLAHEPSTPLEEYLAYYVSRLEPGYAVLVTGPWGAGKTHQVKAALPSTHAYYVSLFGLGSAADIEAQVFEAMFSGRAKINSISKKIDDIKFSIPGLSFSTGGLASLLTGVFIRNNVDNNKPIIFDDLERSKVDSGILLGVVNRYVEHHKCRVIVIAHDEKIVDGFNDSKEKIFGQTLRVQPNIKAAFNSFLDEFSNSERPLSVDVMRREILPVFYDSGVDSLRVLRHVVEDVGRLLGALEDRHLNNHAAVVEIVRLFAALSIEIRSGRLARTDLHNRHGAALAHAINRKSEDKPQILIANERYKLIDLENTTITDDILEEAILDGRFDKLKISKSLDSSPFFYIPEDTPNWRVVIDFDKLDDDIISPALERMESEISNRKELEPGALLHAVALQMMMASEGLTECSVNEVAEAAVQYIDDMLKLGKILPRPPRNGWEHSLSDSHAGVTYWLTDKYIDKFKFVLKHLLKSMNESLSMTLPEKAKNLLDTLRNDGEKFFERVCYTAGREIEFEDVPVLAEIPPKEFVDAWLESPKKGWYWIGNALKDRLQRSNSFASLVPEREWCRKVREEMMARAAAKDGLVRLRIRRAASHIPAPSNPEETSAGT